MLTKSPRPLILIACACAIFWPGAFIFGTETSDRGRAYSLRQPVGKASEATSEVRFVWPLPSAATRYTDFSIDDGTSPDVTPGPDDAG